MRDFLLSAYIISPAVEEGLTKSAYSTSIVNVPVAASTAVTVCNPSNNGLVAVPSVRSIWSPTAKGCCGDVENPVS